MKTNVTRILLLCFFISACWAQDQVVTFATRSDVVEQINKARTLPSVFAAVIQESYSNYTSYSSLQSTIHFLNTVTPLSALSNQSGLDAVAQFHANYLNSGVSDWLNPHIGCNDSVVSNRVALAGNCGSRVAENIASGIQNAEQLVATWIIDNHVSSKKNRMNVFDPSITDIGIGISGSQDNSTIYVAVFAADFICTSPCVNASKIGGQYDCTGSPFAAAIVPKVTAALLVIISLALMV